MVVGSFTVRAVVFTVVISSPGVCHYQQLLDVTLEGKKGEKIGQHISGSNNRFYTLEIELGSIFPTGKTFYVSQMSLNKKQEVCCIINTIG